MLTVKSNNLLREIRLFFDSYYRYLYTNRINRYSGESLQLAKVFIFMRNILKWIADMSLKGGFYS